MPRNTDHQITPIPSSELVDQTRALRVVLAYLDDDLVQLTAVSQETASDPRGADLSLWSLTAALGATLTDAWLERGSVEAVRLSIQRGLALATAGAIDA